MSFGAAAPVEVVVSGPKMADNRAFAQTIRTSMEKIAVLKDIRYGQTLDYPTVDVKSIGNAQPFQAFMLMMFLNPWSLLLLLQGSPRPTTGAIPQTVSGIKFKLKSLKPS